MAEENRPTSFWAGPGLVLLATTIGIIAAVFYKDSLIAQLYYFSQFLAALAFPFLVYSILSKNKTD